MPLRPELLGILVCPACHSELCERDDSLTCLSSDCRLCYAVRDDIPVMLVEEAEQLEVDAWREKTAQKKQPNSDLPRNRS